MEIITVKNPLQDEITYRNFGKKIQLINGVEYYWCVKSSDIQHTDTSFQDFINKLENENNKMIILYDVIPMFKDGVSYSRIRWDFPRKRCI